MHGFRHRSPPARRSGYFTEAVPVSTTRPVVGAQASRTRMLVDGGQRQQRRDDTCVAPMLRSLMIRDVGTALISSATVAHSEASFTSTPLAPDSGEMSIVELFELAAGALDITQPGHAFEAERTAAAAAPGVCWRVDLVDAQQAWAHDTSDITIASRPVGSMEVRHLGTSDGSSCTAVCSVGQHGQRAVACPEPMRFSPFRPSGVSRERCLPA